MPPFVDFRVDLSWGNPVGFLGNDGRGPASVEFGEEPVCVERLVGQKGAEFMALDQFANTGDVVAMAWQQHKVDKVAEGIRQCQDLAGDAAARFAYGLAFSPPFAPCPCR